MVGINEKYIPINILQQYFVDKNNGYPLSGGRVEFYSDLNRSITKQVYKLSGNPPDYIYTTLGNVLILSSQGTFIDQNGSDISVYLYPYDSDGNAERYYIVVYDSLGAPQFTREAVPTIYGISNIESQTILNYCTNPQFLNHLNIGETGLITQDETIIATGGWSFKRPIGSAAIDYLTFDEFGSAIENPSGNPKYAVRVRCTSPNVGDAYKVLSLKFDDVNTFSDETQYYTLFFSATSNAGVQPIIGLKIRKHYGDGLIDDIQTINPAILVGSSYSTFTNFFTFGSNVGEIIGENSYIAIEVWFPTTFIFDISLVDFILTPGNVAISTFPVTPTSNVMSRSVTLPVMNPDGSDLYLPILSSKEGLIYDKSSVGKIYSTISNDLEVGYLRCDGSWYKTTDYSPDGIPYSRLQKVLWNPNLLTPIAGTGTTYLTSIFNGTDLPQNSFIITNNNYGTCNIATDGLIPTNFTFSPIGTGATGHYNINSYCILPNNQFIIQGRYIGNGLFSTGNINFTFNDYAGGHTGYNYDKLIFLVTACAASNITGGQYFTFSPLDINGVLINYYVWYIKDGIGIDPLITPYGIPVRITSADSLWTVTIKTQLALNGVSCTFISNVLPANLMTPGCYFNIYSPSSNFYIWYTIDNAGYDPAIPSSYGIKVDLLSTDTSDQVIMKTQTAINMLYFAVPDLRGLFLRGLYGDVAGVDVAEGLRYSANASVRGSIPCTLQYDQNLQHLHDYTKSLADIVINQQGTVQDHFTDGLRQTSIAGYYESRPKNAAVNYIIKY